MVLIRLYENTSGHFLLFLFTDLPKIINAGDKLPEELDKTRVSSIPLKAIAGRVDRCVGPSEHISSDT